MTDAETILAISAVLFLLAMIMIGLELLHKD